VFCCAIQLSLVVHLFQLFIMCKMMSVSFAFSAWHCWLGGRKGIRPVKSEWWGAGMVICLGQGADLHMAQLMSLPLTHSCFSKSCLVLAFWYWLTWVVPDKGPLSGCFCVLNVSASTPWEFSKQLGNLELTCNLGNLLKRILGIFTGTQVTEMYLHLSDTQSYV